MECKRSAQSDQRGAKRITKRGQMAARVHPEIDVRKIENEIVSNVERETEFGCHV